MNLIYSIDENIWFSFVLCFSQFVSPVSLAIPSKKVQKCLLFRTFSIETSECGSIRVTICSPILIDETHLLNNRTNILVGYKT